MALVGDFILRGTRAAQPAPATTIPASLYYVTDEEVIEFNTGSSWVPFSGAGNATAAILGLPAGLGFGDEGDGDGGMVAPGLQGAAGAAGATGAQGPMGPPGWAPDDPEDPLLIPGPAGAAGSGGAGGAGDYEILDRMTIAYIGAYNSGGTAGIAPVGDDGIATISGTISRSVQAENVYNDFLTAAAGSAQAGWRGATINQTQQRHLPQYDIFVRSPDTLTSLRLWIGLTSAAFTDVDTHAGHCAAFRFSSVAGDTGWTPVTRDGTTQNTGTTIGTVVAATAYHLRIRFAGTSVFFSVDGGAEQQLSANIPGSTTDIGVDHRIIAQAASARNFKFSRSRLIFGV